METNVTLKELTVENIRKVIDMKGSHYDTNTEINTILSDKKFYNELKIKYGIIYNFDSVEYNSIDKLDIDFDNIIEARFFNNDIEIDIRMEDDEIKGNIFIDNGENELFVDEKLYLKRKEKGSYNKLKIKKYIDFDEDGQAFIFYLKPCELIKED
jgi:hypothetical protein